MRKYYETGLESTTVFESNGIVITVIDNGNTVKFRTHDTLNGFREVRVYTHGSIIYAKSLEKKKREIFRYCMMVRRMNKNDRKAF